MILKVLKTALVAPRYSRKRGCRASPGIDTFQTFLRESGFATASLGPGEKVDNVGEAVGLRPTQKWVQCGQSGHAPPGRTSAGAGTYSWLRECFNSNVTSVRSTRVPLAALSPQSWRVLLGLAAWHRRYLSCLRGLFCFANPKWPAQTKVKPLHMFAAAWSVCLASGPKECGFAFFCLWRQPKHQL